jgi:hypothetical protein
MIFSLPNSRPLFFVMLTILLFYGLFLVSVIQILRYYCCLILHDDMVFLLSIRAENKSAYPMDLAISLKGVGKATLWMK